MDRISSGAYISDSFTVLPDDTLSTEYFVASVEATANLGVVATEDNTLVSVILNATCEYVFNGVHYTDGDTVNVTLGYGDVFQIGLESSSSDDKCDLGGTQIHSNLEVAVFSGALFLYRATCDGLTLNPGHMISQVPPVGAFTKTQIIPKVVASDLWAMAFRVLAMYDNTVVNITKDEANGNVVTWSTSLNTAEFKQYCSSSSANFIIQSTQPVMCTERIYFRSDAGTSLFVPGTALYDNNYIVKSLDLDGVNSESPMITIVSEVSSFMDVRVNDQHRTDIQWTNLTTVPYTVGALHIHPDITYVVNSSSPILVRLLERFGRESYSYNAGYRLLQLPETCSKGMVIFKNTLVYSSQWADHLVQDIIWLHDISCSEPVDGTDSVHLYPDINTTVHGSTSGQVQGPSVHISLYQDASYKHPLMCNLIHTKIGTPVYVQVASPGTSNTIMVLQSCEAHLDSVPRKQPSYPLIADGCAVAAHTQILVTRNSVTRFKFDMFDIPNEQDGIYITCHVTFCDPMDFSDKCQQQCHGSPHIIG